MFSAYLRLIRWSNLLMLLVLMGVMELWVAEPVLNHLHFGAQMPWYVLMLLMMAVVFIAAGGYVINDYFDIKIDRINRPERLIVSAAVSKQAAMRLHLSLSVFGVLCGLAAAWLTRSWMLALVMLFTPGLLWFYSSSYKRQFFVGNLIVSFLAALPPITIAMANVGILRHRFGAIMSYSSCEHDLYMWLGGFALFAFLITWIREIIKDLQDQEGDRELECHTLPIRLGDTATKILVTVLAGVTTALLCWIGLFTLPYPHAWNTLSSRYILFGILTPLWCAMWLMWAARIPSDYRTAQLVVKFTMLMGILYSFVIERCL